MNADTAVNAAMSRATAPVRAAMLRRAREEAARQVAAADERARQAIEEADHRARELLARARAEGMTDAAALRTADLARTRRAARGLELSAQREAYQELLRRVRAGLLADGGAARLRTLSVARIRALLGPDALITERPDGGARGDIAGRRVDCSVDGLVEVCVAARAGRVGGMWEP